MAPTGKKSRNWTNKEDEKLFDVLLEQKAQGATQFEWGVVKALMKNEGVDRDSMQIRNHYNDVVKKLRAWEWLTGQSGVGVNNVTGAFEVSDSTWANFLQKYGGRYKSFRERQPANLEKMKALVHGRHATGDLSFSPAMAGRGSDRNAVDDVMPQDLEEHMGDSDEADADYSNDQRSAGEESRSPPRTVQTNSRKRRSEGGSSGEARRLRQELAESSVRNAEVQNALETLRVREQARIHPPPCKMELCLTKLRQHPAVAARGSDFIFDVMEYLRREKDFDYFALFTDDDITRYLQRRGLWDM